MRRLLYACLGLFALAAPAAAQNWPTRPVKIIVPYGPGGSADNLTRPFAEKLSQALGQQFVIENRAGASGAIGVEAAVKAAPDGYTLLATPYNALVIVPHARKVAYDPFGDLAPVGRTADSYFAMAVRPELGVKTLQEFIARAKSKPGQMTFGSAGIATTTQFSGEILKIAAGIDMIHVPYKGAGDALIDLLGGQIDTMIEGNVMPAAKAGKLILLGVITPDRHPDFPDVPAIREIVPGYEMSNWVGFLAPAKTPVEIVRKLNAELVKIAEMPDVKTRLLAVGARPVSDTPDGMTAEMRRLDQRFSKIIADLGIKLE